MRTNPFEMFLGNVFVGEKNGTTLGSASIRDAISRCRRIERCLGVDLDRGIEGREGGVDSLLDMIECQANKFDIDGNVNEGISSIKNAAKLYHEFLKWKRRK
jgi:hypothetical protein